MENVKGVELKEMFVTSDDRSFLKLEDANSHQLELNLIEKRKLIEENIRNIIELPYRYDKDDTEERKFLEEIKQITGVDYEEFSNLISDLILMVEMKTLPCKWSQIFRIIEIEKGKV